MTLTSLHEAVNVETILYSLQNKTLRRNRDKEYACLAFMLDDTIYFLLFCPNTRQKEKAKEVLGCIKIETLLPTIGK